MKIILRELRAHLKSIIIWCVVMAFIIFAGMSKYSAFASSGEDITALLESMPPAIQSVIGLGTLDLTTAIGFYGIMFLYFAVLGAIHAGMLGAGLIAKEEIDKTADFLFVKPMRRHEILVYKFLAGLILLVVLNAFTIGFSAVVLTSFEAVDKLGETLMKLSGALFGVQAVFYSLGFGIAGGSRNTKKASTVVSALILISFFLSIAIDINDKIAFLSFLSPFKYFDAKEVLFEVGFQGKWIFLSVIIVLVSIVIAIMKYSKRDIV